METKDGAADLVTEFDQRVEEILIKQLKEKFPTHKLVKKLLKEKFLQCNKKARRRNFNAPSALLILSLEHHCKRTKKHLKSDPKTRTFCIETTSVL